MLIHEHGGPIQMGPKKWPNQAAFILFRQINLGSGCPVSEESKYSLGLR